MTLKLQLKCKQLADLYKEYDKKVNPALLRKVVKGESSRRRLELGDKLREARDSFTNIQDMLVQLSDLAEKLQDQFDSYEEVRTVLETSETFGLETVTLQYQEKGTKILREAETELAYLMKDVRKTVKRVKFGTADKEDKPDVVKSTAKKEQKDTSDKKDKAAKRDRADKKEKERTEKKEKEKAEKKERKEKKEKEESKPDTPKAETAEASAASEASPQQTTDQKQAETRPFHPPPLQHRHTVDVLPRVPTGGHPTPFHAVTCRNCDRPPQYEEPGARPSYNIYPQVVTSDVDSQLPRKQ